MRALLASRTVFFVFGEADLTKNPGVSTMRRDGSARAL
jgi:hypothetical protein